MSVGQFTWEVAMRSASHWNRQEGRKLFRVGVVERGRGYYRYGIIAVPVVPSE